jgi:hypothetical protein
MIRLPILAWLQSVWYAVVYFCSTSLSCGYNPSMCSIDFLKPSMKWRSRRDRLYSSSNQQSSSVSNSRCIIDSFRASLLSSMQFVFFKLPYLAWNMSPVFWAVYFNLFAFTSFRFEFLLSIDICAECDMWHYASCVLIWWHGHLYETHFAFVSRLHFEFSRDILETIGVVPFTLYNRQILKKIIRLFTFHSIFGCRCSISDSCRCHWL